MRQRAFTLTELLIVIAVIMILLGLLFPVLRMVQAEAMKTKALSELQIIKAGCELYKSLNGAYPDCANPAIPNMNSVFLNNGQAPVQWSQINATGWQTVANNLLTCLNLVDRDHFPNTASLANTTLANLRDPWKQLYRYRPPQYYPYVPSANGTAVPPIDSSTPPDQDSCQLWSCGPNMIDEAGEHTSPPIGLTTTSAPDDIQLQ